MRKKLFLIFIGIWLVTYFTQDRYRWVTDISPEVLTDPIQTKVADGKPILFTKDGFSYTLTPLFDYDISGLVVHRMIYNRWFSLSRTDSVFFMDLCMIWGENVKRGTYRNGDVDFLQDARFCRYSYGEGHEIFNNALSNNHLVIRDDDKERLVEAIQAGDQVRIRGKLVNVEAKALANPERYEPTDLLWPTSTTRDDTGAGACETIFVESVEILRRGNPSSRVLHSVSFYGIIILFVWALGELTFEVYRGELLIQKRS
ncbi:MAG: hypothetical protein A3D57_02685 [Candidatus Sungbacteria bacterium RIFCSPHIGHO2_02_FULL_46_12]|nr:MAG: hypothetical protein A3D57_02685 [Candidatus Sungbacteria bacterium RIFCSPHIGHO2_02_FULL_46_12]